MAGFDKRTRATAGNAAKPDHPIGKPIELPGKHAAFARGKNGVGPKRSCGDRRSRGRKREATRAFRKNQGVLETALSGQTQGLASPHGKPPGRPAENGNGSAWARGGPAGNPPRATGKQNWPCSRTRLRKTEQTHEALSASSQEAIAFSAKERQTLEERVLHETGRVRDLGEPAARPRRPYKGNGKIVGCRSA